MSEEFKIEVATRRGVIPLIGLYGGPGVGKTKSALLLARGFVGPSGKIRMIDTESRRGSFYADEIPGGYSTLNLDPPFSPLRYIAAMKAVIADGAQIICVDSISHCWEGEGGVRDMAAANEERTGKPGLHNWNKPKYEHALMLQFMLRSPVPIICCMRAKQKTRTERDDRGKQVIKKDDYYTPITEGDFAFELTTAYEILPDHSLTATKRSHGQLNACFPERGPITIEHGKMIADWCSAAGGSVAPAPTPNPRPKMSPALAELMEATKSIHNGDGPTLKAWLVKEGLISEDAMLSKLPEKALKDLKTQTEILLGTPA